MNISVTSSYHVSRQGTLAKCHAKIRCRLGGEHIRLTLEDRRNIRWWKNRESKDGASVSEITSSDVIKWKRALSPVKPPKPVHVSVDQGERERVGISVEVSIADAFGIDITEQYRGRGREDVVKKLKPLLKDFLEENQLPKPVKHIAEGQNPIDFLLEEGKTLSVKSNMKGSTAVAPQRIGQPTAATFWARFKHLAEEGTDFATLKQDDSEKMFKRVAQKHAPQLLTAYWENLFDCDYLVHVGKVLDDGNGVNDTPTLRLYSKEVGPAWDPKRITFSQTPEEWKESCTVKYDGFTIGSWQVHGERSSFKFRFQLDGLKRAGLV